MLQQHSVKSIARTSHPAKKRPIKYHLDYSMAAYVYSGIGIQTCGLRNAQARIVLIELTTGGKNDFR